MKFTCFVQVLPLFLLFFFIKIVSAQNLDSGLIGFYPFNGNAGDSSLSNPINHGSVAEASFVCGPSDSAIYFDGINDHVVLDTNFSLDSVYSISLWIKPSEIQLGSFFSMRNQCPNSPRGWDRAQMGLISKNARRVYNDPAIITVDNQLVFMHSRSNDNCNEWSSQHVYTIPGLGIDTSCYTHLVIMVKSNSNLNRNYIVYVNGVFYQATLYSLPSPKNILNTTDAFSQPSSLFTSFLGVTHNNFSFSRNLHSFSGAIDQLRFYNRSISPNEVIALYQEGFANKLPILKFNNSIVCGNQMIEVSIDSSANCDSFSWTLNGSFIGSADSILFKKRTALPDTLQLVYHYRNTCNEIILNQIFTLPAIDTVYRTLCPNDSVLFNGKWYNQSGIFVDTMKTQDCDSITILSITKIGLELELGDNRQLCIGDSITLDVFAPNQIYLWQDNSSASSLKVSSSGIYSVTVSNTCETKSDSVNISMVDCNCILTMPNVFTPNSDGINDLLIPLPDCLTSEYTLSIFNRWGDKLFESSSSKLAWDGTQSGEEVPEGVYLYFVSYKTLLGTQRVVSGNILLLR